MHTGERTKAVVEAAALQAQADPNHPPNLSIDLFDGQSVLGRAPRSGANRLYLSRFYLENTPCY